jgi:hypothetical protein
MVYENNDDAFETSAKSPMIIVPTYRGHRIEVNAIAVDGRWNAEVCIRRVLSSDKPHRRDGNMPETASRSRGARRRDLGRSGGSI